MAIYVTTLLKSLRNFIIKTFVFAYVQNKKHLIANIKVLNISQVDCVYKSNLIMKKEEN